MTMTRWLLSVHPHARGEYLTPESWQALDYGSPPRTWGIRRDERLHRPLPRVTPTHVGNTREEGQTATPRAVHPHARGEYGRRRPGFAWRTGSPPRTWGIRTLRLFKRLFPRFTPTHVGNTPSLPHCWSASSVH